MPLPTQDEVRIVGLGVSPGVAIGRAHLAEGFFSEPTLNAIPPAAADREWARFQEAIERTKRQLQGLLDRAATDAGAGHAGIFEAHLLMAEDPSLLKAVERGIREQHLQAEGVFHREMQRYMQAMRRFDDDYLRERVIDLEDVMRRILGNMGGPCDTSAPDFPHILLAHDLAPSQTLEMDRALMLGFATEVGSQTSHTAILARSLGIPAVVGLYDVHSHIRGGDDILLDGAEGVLIVRPRPDTVAAYQSRQRRRARVDTQLIAIRHGDATTRDGHRVTISANIELAEEMPTVMNSGAEGVGLYRTEFLFMNRRDWPTEDEQAENYSAVARQAGEHGVIIRTLDIGGDKLPSHTPDAPPTAPEGNPFLGFRGIRRSLQEPHIFKRQLRAILRASAVGRVRVMYPLLSGLDEIRQANAILAECMDELRREGIPFDGKIERGAMIEVPSAAVMADVIGDEADFFSVGTNDLIQYTIAVDRVNERVANLYQPWHPAIVRLLKMVVDAAASNHIWAGLCGEMAGDLAMTPLLLGLGFSELSVSAIQIPRLKHAVRSLYIHECRTLVQRVLRMRHDREIFSRTRELARTYYAELLE